MLSHENASPDIPVQTLLTLGARTDPGDHSSSPLLIYSIIRKCRRKRREMDGRRRSKEESMYYFPWKQIDDNKSRCQ